MESNLENRIAATLSEHWRDSHTNESLGKQKMLAKHVMRVVQPEIDDLKVRMGVALRALTGDDYGEFVAGGDATDG